MCFLTSLTEPAWEVIGGLIEEQTEISVKIQTIYTRVVLLEMWWPEELEDTITSLFILTESVVHMCMCVQSQQLDRYWLELWWNR